MQKTTPAMSKWIFPADINGWTTEQETRRLAELAEGKIVLECGTWCGLSTVSMAQTAKHVHTVDFHAKWEMHGNRDTLTELRANLERYKVQNKVTIHVGPVQEVAAALRDKYFDVIFHDAGHSYCEVYNDIHALKHCIKQNGIWVVHDYNNIEYQCGEVKPAVDACLPGPFELVGYLAITNSNYVMAKK